MAKCCNGDSAAHLGRYRFLRNDAVSTEQVAEGGFGTAIRQIDKSQRLLALEEWRVLRVATECEAPSTETPSVRWVYRAAAKLGRFVDTERTGRPGWSTLWYGWFRLQERLEGYRQALSRQPQRA